MKYVSKIAAILITAGGIIFYLGFRVENYNLLLLVTGGALVGIGMISTILIKKKEEKEMTSEYESWKQRLIRDGIKINVDLNNVLIKSNNYREEIIDAEYNRYKALDNMVGRDNREFTNVNDSVVVYETEVFGNKKTFYSPPIAKDKISLQLLLSARQTTHIFADRVDQKNYFFDLEFLFEG